MRQVAAIRETETHETILRLNESGESGEAVNMLSVYCVYRTIAAGNALRGLWQGASV